MGRREPQEAAGTPGFFASLVYPDYRRLWGATACSQAAAWALIVLRGALVYELTQSNAWVGLVTMAAQLPSLVVTPLVGFLADRCERRRLLALTYGLNLANSLLLAGLVVSGKVTAFSLLGLAVLNGIIRATEMPTNQALLPNLVPRERLLNAVALNQLMQQGARMTGPLLILPIIRFLHPEPAFFVSAGLYAVGWSQVRRIRTASRGVVVAHQGLLVNLVAGIRYMYTQPLVCALMLVTVFHCALTMAYESAFPFFSRAQLGMTTAKDLFEGPTYLMIGLGAGSILGNLGLARVVDQRVRGQLFLWLGLLSGLTPIGLGCTTTLPTAMLAAAAVGASTAAFMVLSQGTIQALCPDGIRGRVMSANTWHIQGTMAGFNAVNGLVMDLPWMTAPLLLSGTGLLFVVLLLSSILTAHLRTLYVRGLPSDVLAGGREEGGDFRIERAV
jgi:MFS family permease